jgi:hypothetical protein
MAEQAQSSSETSESGNNENMQEMMIKFMQKLEEKLDKNTIQIQNMEENSNVKFQNMGEKFDKNSVEMYEKLDKYSAEMHERFEQSENKFRQVTKENEIEVFTKSEISSAKKRRIRKMRILKSRGIKISKFRKRQEKATRLGRVKKSCNCYLIKYKKSSFTNYKHVKPQSKLTENRKFRHDVFWTNQNPVKSRKSRFNSKITCEEVSRGLGEQLYTKCHKGRSNETSEKLKNCTNCQKLQSSFQTRTKVLKKSIVTKQSLKERTNLHEECTNRVKLKCQGEMPHERLMKESMLTGHNPRVGNSYNKSRNNQKQQQLFQIGIHLTKSSHKLGTKWPELIQGKKTDKNRFFKTKEGLSLMKAKQISFKMKRRDEIVRFRKINVKMKVMSEQANFEKLKWKFKDGIYNPKTIC